MEGTSSKTSIQSREFIYLQFKQAVKNHKQGGPVSQITILSLLDRLLEVYRGSYDTMFTETNLPFDLIDLKIRDLIPSVFEYFESIDPDKAKSWIHQFVNARDATDATPLHYASRDGLSEITKILIQNGADVNSISTHFRTPLILATINAKNTKVDDEDSINYRHIIDYLLEAGANPALTPKGKASAFALALNNNDNIIVEKLLKHNNGIALVAEASHNQGTFIKALNTFSIDFIPIIELISDAYNAKPMLPTNKGPLRSETKKFAKCFFAAFDETASVKILPSNAFGILKLLNNLSPVILSDLKTTNSLATLINSALQDPSLHLELLDYALQSVSSFGYKYASIIARNIIESSGTEAPATASAAAGAASSQDFMHSHSDILEDARLIVEISNYEKKSGKIYKKPLEVFKREIESVDQADEIYFDTTKTPLLVEILKDYVFSDSDSPVNKYLEKYKAAEKLHIKLRDMQSKFLGVSDDLNKIKQQKLAKNKSAKPQAFDQAKFDGDIKAIEDLCLEVSSARASGIFVNCRDFLKSLNSLRIKLPSLNIHDLLSTAEPTPLVETAESSAFDGKLSLGNLITYSTSKTDSFRAAVKRSFSKPERKLDSREQEKFLGTFEKAVLQAESSKQIFPDDAICLYKIKNRVPAAFLKAYLENTADGILKAVLGKFSGIDDRTTVRTAATYATSVVGAGAGKGAVHEGAEDPVYKDDREISEFVPDEYEEGDCAEAGAGKGAVHEDESKDSVSDHKGEDAQSLTKNFIKILEKIYAQEKTSKRELKTLSDHFNELLEFTDTKSGWTLKYIPTGKTTGSHRDHASKDKFLPKSGDGGKAASLYEFFDEIEFFRTLLNRYEEERDASPTDITDDIYDDLPHLEAASEQGDEDADGSENNEGKGSSHAHPAPHFVDPDMTTLIGEDGSE